ncbi:MAG: oligoendopeptidase F [Synergistales bacterium]|nr:oligoendopeptidase F [Synergistales bacterium]
MHSRYRGGMETPSLRRLCRSAEGDGAAGELPERHELDPEFMWRPGDIFPDEVSWERALEEVDRKGREIEGYQGSLAASAATLAACLRLEDEAEEQLGRVCAYASLRSHENTGDAHCQGLEDRATECAVRFESTVSFISPEILSIPEEQLQAHLEAEALAPFRFAMEQLLRVKPHVLSGREEQLLARLGSVTHVPETAFSMLTNADLTFPLIRDEEGREVRLTEERFSRFLLSPERRVRREAFEGLFTTYRGVRNTLGATLAGSVKHDAVDADLRGYRSSLEAALYPNRIPEAVYHSALEGVHGHLHQLQRYVELKRKALRLEEMHIYDLYTPVVPEPESVIPYDRARETVVKALSPLGVSYQRLLEQAFDGGWIDVYENRGKRGGAYSMDVYGVHPFVLLNYNATLRDVFTLAHELGHAAHSRHTQESQPHLYAGHEIFVAEVASTTNEALLLRHLLATTTDPQQELYLLHYGLEQVRTTVFRQLLFAEFELAVHRMAEQQQPLTAQTFSDLWLELKKSYYGEAVVMDDGIEVEWARIPHFYAGFYVYQYATGLAAATSLSRAILEEGEEAGERYLAFLRKGRSDYPINQLRDAGVDMTTPKPLEATFDLFAQRLDRFEQLLGIN